MTQLNTNKKWYVFEYTKNADKIYCEISGQTICEVNPYSGATKLIESAPELLSALQGVLDSLSQNKTFPADIENAKRLARAAIKKARGN